MTAGTGDLQQGQAGFGGEPTPAIPGSGNGVVPTDSHDAPLSAQGAPPSDLGSEGGDDFELHEDEIAFLQSEPVQRWLSQNVPQGFVPEERMRENVATVQSIKDQEVQQAREQAKRVEGELDQHRAQVNALVGALQHAWREAGIEEGSDDWRQRMAQVQQYVQNLSNQAQVERNKNTEMLTRFADQHEQDIDWQLQLAGVDRNVHPNVGKLIQLHRQKIESNEYENVDAAKNAARHIVQYAVQARNLGQQQGMNGQPQGNQQAQAPVQNGQGQQQATQPPQQQQARPNPGPARLPRRGGGSSNLSPVDRYEQAYQSLLAEHGNDPFKIPPEKVDEIWVNAYAGVGG